jgi:hypothetical protein
MKYEVEVTANVGYIVTVEADHEIEAIERAEELVKRDLDGAIWINLESYPLPVRG